MIISPEYPKVQTIFKRQPEDKKTLRLWDFTCPEFEYLAPLQWVATEKVDGTNIRVSVMPGRGGVNFFGRTDRAEIPKFLLEALGTQFLPLADALFEQFPDGACLYGEGYGPKIQKGGGNYRDTPGFVLFDVLVGARWWLQRGSVNEVAAQLGIDCVPSRTGGTLAELVDDVRKGITSSWGNFQAEGLIIEPAVPLQTRALKRIITKLKTRDFAHVIDCREEKGGGE